MPIAFAQTRISGPLRGRATFGLVAEPSYDLPAMCIRRTADMRPNPSPVRKDVICSSSMQRRLSVNERQLEDVSRRSSDLSQDSCATWLDIRPRKDRTV